VSETIVAVEALARDGSGARRFDAAACGFGYRDSVFKREERDRWVILGVTYRLQPGGPPAVRYAELGKRLEEEGGPLDVARVRSTVLALRRAKGMVLDPGDPDTRSDGSFFMNPVIPAGALRGFLERVASLGIDPTTAPRFPGPDGGVKLAAGWLIERAGLRKGHRHGGVGISTKHALAIVNRGGGTAAEVLELVREIRRRVEDCFAVLLQPEPTFVGFPTDPLEPA
jgi:UDP-N-acetylmuramate dehydrogenase